MLVKLFIKQQTQQQLKKTAQKENIHRGLILFVYLIRRSLIPISNKQENSRRYERELQVAIDNFKAKTKKHQVLMKDKHTNLKSRLNKKTQEEGFQIKKETPT